MNCGANNFNQAPAEEDCEDCVQVVKTHKNVAIPCTRNQYRQYTVRVPRTVQEKVARQVNFTEYESRTRQVPYTVNRPEERVRMECQSYQVPVQKTNTRMVPVTRKVPKTIYVDVTTQVPQQYTTTVMENRTKQVPIKYTVQVPETKQRTETYQVPVQKTKTVYDNVTKVHYDTQVRTQCVPVTKMVMKRVPVYNVVAKPAAPCPPGMDCGQDGAAMAGAAMGAAMGGAVGGAVMGAAMGAAMGGNAGLQADVSNTLTLNAPAAPMGGSQMGTQTVGAQMGAAMGYAGSVVGGYAGSVRGRFSQSGGAPMGSFNARGASSGQGYNGGRAAEYRSEFQSLDKNGDGRIDFAEYQAARNGGGAAQGAAAGGAAAAGGQAGFNAGAASGGASAADQYAEAAAPDLPANDQFEAPRPEADQFEAPRPDIGAGGDQYGAPRPEMASEPQMGAAPDMVAMMPIAVESDRSGRKSRRKRSKGKKGKKRSNSKGRRGRAFSLERMFSN